MHARGNVEEADLEAELSLLTKQGKTNAGFATGASVLQGILLDSGEIEKVGTMLRSIRAMQMKTSNSRPPRREIAAANEILPASGLRRIPVPVSAGSIWYVEVAENPDEFEVAKFLDMQKLIFSKTR